MSHNASLDNSPLEQPVSGPTCCKKKCPVTLTPDTLCRCLAKGCKKHIHYACYEGIVSKNRNVKLSDSINNVEQVICSKVCYNKAIRQLVREKEDEVGHRLKWDEDGKLGINDPKTSMQILMNWLLTEGNYSQY